jgi:iron(III) transport system permease protein
MLPQFRFRRKSRGHAGSLILAGLVLLFFAVFLFYPVGYLLQGAFGAGGRFSLEYFGMLVSSPLQREALANSLFIALATTALTTVLALPLAQLVVRYGFPGKTVLTVLLLVPMVMPPFVGAIGMRQLLARFGSLNLLLIHLGVVPAHQPIDWLGGGGLSGIIILQTLSLYPILFLNVSAALANVDPTLHEAARNLGASGWRLFRTITLPLLLPGYFAGASIVFIWAFTDLGTPLIFGESRVVPVQIFDAMTEVNTNPMGYAMVVFVLLATLVLFLSARLSPMGKQYDMFGRGHGVAAETPVHGWCRLLIWGACLSLVLIALLPHLMVVVHSFAQRWCFTVFPSEWSGENYADIFSQDLTVLSIRNSLFYSGCSSILDLVLGLIIAWLVTRRQVPFATLLDALAMLPLALPGLVLAFGYVAGFDFPVSWINPRSNPTLLLIVSYSVRRLPYIVRSAVAGFQQTSITLEEASANLGAGPWRTFMRITLPLISAHLIAGVILTFSFAMLEVSDSLMLAMREPFFPITKTIWQLLGRIDPNASSVACALGVVGMLILGGSLIVAAKIMGRSIGQLFRA